MTVGDSTGKILLIEDDQANIDMLEYLLSGSGFTSLSALNGVSGMQIAIAEKPDIILLDVMMQGIDGFETCRRLKANAITKDIPVIFLTSRVETQDKVKGLGIGAVDYITKPFQYAEIIARIRNHILINQQRMEIERLRTEERRYYEKLSQMKDEVLSSTSHDLKSPLSVILFTLTMLRKHGRIDDEQGQKLLETVESSATQMRTFIAGVLDLAQIETGHGLDLQEISVNSYLQTTFKSISPLAQGKNINLQFIPSKSDCLIQIDTMRMNQVMSNLFSNAIKYTSRHGEVKLVSDVRRRIVLIQIQDNGLGIPEDDIPRIFEKFYRVNDKEHLAQEGTGLGLSIVKSIVEQHHGNIWVERNPDTGITINITLPIHEKNRDDTDAAIPIQHD